MLVIGETKEKPTMKPIEAVFEDGHLKPLQWLPLPEHQHVWVMILSAEPSAHDLARLATTSPSFQFLANSAEDVYSSADGRPV